MRYNYQASSVWQTTSNPHLRAIIEEEIDNMNDAGSRRRLSPEECMAFGERARERCKAWSIQHEYH